jgi:hypothetical protein
MQSRDIIQVGPLCDSDGRSGGHVQSWRNKDRPGRCSMLEAHSLIMGDHVLAYGSVSLQWQGGPVERRDPVPWLV